MIVLHMYFSSISLICRIRDPFAVLLYLFFSLLFMFYLLILLLRYSLLLALKRIRKKSNLEDPEYFYYSVFLSGRHFHVIIYWLLAIIVVLILTRRFVSGVFQCLQIILRIFHFNSWYLAITLHSILRKRSLKSRIALKELRRLKEPKEVIQPLIYTQSSGELMSTSRSFSGRSSDGMVNRTMSFTT